MESKDCYPRHPLEYYGKKVKELGQGRYGKVYLTNGGKHGTPVAVKVLNRYTDLDLDDGTGRFPNIELWREIAFLTQLRHPNIPRILDVHRDENSYYLVQESPAVSPDDIQSEQVVSDVIFALAQVYAYLEREGIMHLDLKLDNILLSDENAYLIDFGVAIIVSPADMLKRSRGPDNAYWVGSRPPEMLLGVSFYDFKVEIWALGVLVLQLLQLNRMRGIVTFRPFTGLFSTEDEDWAVLMSYLLSWQDQLGPILEAWPEAIYLPRGSYLTLSDKITERSTIIKKSKLDIATQELLEWMLAWNPKERCSATQLLEMFSGTHKPIPTFEDCLDRRSRIVKRPRAFPTTHQRYQLLEKLIIALDTLPTKMLTRTFFLIVTLYDLFVAEVAVSEDMIKLYLIGACVVANVMHNSAFPFMILANLMSRYTEKDILDAADLITTTLCYELFQATSFDYLALKLPRNDFCSLVAELRFHLRTDLVYDKTPTQFYNAVFLPENRKKAEVVSHNISRYDSIPINLIPNPI